MDGIKVTPLDRFRNRLRLWIREQFYQLPMGHHLQQGLNPAMVNTLNTFFAGRDLGMYLPYEVFTEEGLFKNEESYSFGIRIASAKSIGFKQAKELQLDLLGKLPKGLFLQFQMTNIGHSETYECWLNVTGEQTPMVREELISVRADVSQCLEKNGFIVSQVGPADLLKMISLMLDVNETKHYNDEQLIKTQAAISQVSVKNGRMTLSTQDNPTFRDLIIYQARRFGLHNADWINYCYPCVLGKVECFMSLNCHLNDNGVYEGQFLLMEPVAVGERGKLEAALLLNNWLIELDRYCTHLSWLSLMPFGVGPMVYGAIESQRRWTPISLHKLHNILPLPYQANALSPSAPSFTESREVAYG